jgi:MFS family permease
VDRLSRRRVLTVVEVARMVVLLLLGFAIVSHHLLLWELFLATFLVATFETAFDSATTAVIPQLVPRGDLVRANSQFQVAQLSGEQFIGPALGGLAVAAAASLPVFLDGLSFAGSALLLTLALRPVRRLGRHGPSKAADGFTLAEPSRDRRSTLSSEVREGLAWLARDQRIRLLCILNASFAFCQALGLAVVVIYCTRVLRLTPTAFGIFTAAAASGNTIGAWAAPRVHRQLGAGATLLAAGVVGGLALLVVGLTSATGVAAIALGMEAVAVGVGKVAIAALRQEFVPLALAGRVNAAVRSTVVGAAAIAALLGGALTGVLDARAPFVIGGVAQVAVALVIGAALTRRLAAADREIIDLSQEVDLREQAVETA